MKRTVSVFVLVVIAPLLMGAGGPNPPNQTSKTTGPAVTATVVMDIDVGASPIAVASVRLRKGTKFAGALFEVPASFPLNHGCMLTVPPGLGFPVGSDLTAVRFVNTGNVDRQLTDWFPDAALIEDLFLQLGILVDVDGDGVPVGAPVGVKPVIVDVSNAVCSPAEGPAGTLSFEALLQLQIPQ